MHSPIKSCAYFTKGHPPEKHPLPGEQVQKGHGKPLFDGPVEEVEQLVLDLPAFQADHSGHSDGQSGHHLDETVKILFRHYADESVLYNDRGLVPFPGLHVRYLSEHGPARKNVKDYLIALGCQLRDLYGTLFRCQISPSR